MAICRACRTREADSLEHVFPSAIGGRLKVPGITCNPCNIEFGRTIDAHLAEKLKVFRVLLAIKGDRGQQPSVEATDAEGRRIIVGPAYELRYVTPIEIRHEGDRVHLSGDERSIRQFAAAQERKGRKLQFDDASHSYVFPGRLNFKIDTLGDTPFLRSAFKTGLVYAEAHNPVLTGALSAAWDYVNGAEVPTVDASLTATACPWSDPVLGVVPHRVMLHADPARSCIHFDVRYFGELGVRVRLRSTPPTSLRACFGLDPLTRAVVHGGAWAGDIEFDYSTLEALSTHAGKAFDLVYRRGTAIEIRYIAARVVREARHEARGDLVEFRRLVAEKVKILLGRETVRVPSTRLLEWLRAELAAKK